jgi:hypothetical protein
MNTVKDRNEMRLNATSPADFAKRLERFALSHGEKMTVRFDRLFATKSASNSHSHPIGTEYKSNWSRKPEEVLGYPALYGRLYLKKDVATGKYCKDALTGNDFEEIPGLCTGTGGGGHESEYDVTLWLSDFPLWENKVMSYLKLQAEMGEIQRANERRTEELSTLIGNAISSSHENADLISKKVALERRLESEITNAHPELSLFPTESLQSKILKAREKLGINY